MHNTANLIPLSPMQAHEAAQAVKQEIKEAYGLDDEALDEALLAVRHNGGSAVEEVDQKIQEVLISPQWHNAVERAQKKASAPLDTEALNKAAHSIMHGFIGGMTLRNVLGMTSEDPFYGGEIFYNHTCEPVCEALANLYLSHLTNEALSTVRSLGISDAVAMQLVDEMRNAVIHIAQTSHLRTGMGYYLDPSDEPPLDCFEHTAPKYLGAAHKISMQSDYYGGETNDAQPHSEPAGLSAAQRIADVQEYAETLSKALENKRREVQQSQWRAQQRGHRERFSGAHAIGG